MRRTIAIEIASAALVAAGFALGLPSSQQVQPPEFMVAGLCGDSVEMLGFSDALNKAPVADRDVVELSGIARDPARG